VDVVKKEENKAEKKDWKQNNPTGNLTSMNKKEFQKLEREIKDQKSKKLN
jgi:ATP-binding cassette subfamily F protein uup